MTKLPDIKTHFAEWYQEVLTLADLIDASPTRGCFIIKPYGYALWENIQKKLDAHIKELGVDNAYFPLLIPESFLTKEKKHIEGFSPELAVVTIGGGKQLEEPLVVRPTSETIIYNSFARWIKSYRDLPLKINQWANVVRWEMRTRPFVRSLEFLWQEGHTAHHSHEEAVEMALAALNMYKDIYENFLAIPVIAGIKSENERFAGAERTYTIEGLMQDGRGLQMCTSHVLAQSFPASFGVEFQDQSGITQSPFCTSWGFTTRSVGGVIMTHGDQNGIVMPPHAAPIQVVIVPISKTEEERTAVLEYAKKIALTLKNEAIRCHVDAREQETPGAKFYHWEARGVPIRLEIGPKDIAQNKVVLVNRVEEDKIKKKTFVAIDEIIQETHALIAKIHTQLFDRAKARIEAQTHKAEKLSSFGKNMDEQGGWYKTGWCGSTACEVSLKEYKGTLRCLVETREFTECFACTSKSSYDVLAAKAY